MELLIKSLGNLPSNTSSELITKHLEVGENKAIELLKDKASRLKISQEGRYKELVVNLALTTLLPAVNMVYEAEMPSLEISGSERRFFTPKQTLDLVAMYEKRAMEIVKFMTKRARFRLIGGLDNG